MRELLLAALVDAWIEEPAPIPLAYGPLFIRLVVFPPVFEKAAGAPWGKAGTVNSDGSVTWGNEKLANAGAETTFGQIRSAIIDALSNGRRTDKFVSQHDLYVEFCVGTNPAE